MNAISTTTPPGGTLTTGSADQGGEGRAAGATSAPTPFAAAQSMMEPYIIRFGDGGLDWYSVLATADTIAKQCKVCATDLRGWVKQRLDAMQARPAGAPTAPEPPCATDPEPSASRRRSATCCKRS